jgi:hypothetical protein
MSLKSKELFIPGWPSGEKTRGGKNEGNLHYVIENKWRKNARNQSLHYVTENKRVIVVSPLC